MTRTQSRELVALLNRDAERIASQFQLTYRCIEAEHANVTRRYGVCYSDGTIRIRLRHVVSRKPLKYSSLVNTLCHELAHLKHFNHGMRFRDFYRELLEWARAQRIYQPSSSASFLVLPGGDGSAAGQRLYEPREDSVAGRHAEVKATGKVPPAAVQRGSNQTDSKIVGEQLSLFS